MPLWGIAAILAGAFCLLALLHYLSKKKHPLKRALLSMIIGALSLIAVNLTSGFTHVYIPVSLISILISVIGGVPGVTLMLVLNLFF